MHQNLTAAKRTLQWSLNFINRDFERLSEKDIFVLWKEIRERVYGDQGASFISDESLAKWEERRKQGGEIQSTLRGALDTLLTLESKKPPRRVMPSPGRKFFVSAPGTLSFSFRIEAKRVGDVVFPFFSNVGDKLLYDFVTALRQFPISLIQKCQREDCGGYFLKATKKEKRYCSNRCAWIMASRERWKEQPDVAKEKRRQYYQKKKRIEQDSSSPSMEPQESRDTEDREINDTGKIGIKIPS